MSKRLPVPLFVAAFALLILPPVLLALGLTMTSASEVVIYAIACMALNILVGHTGLVSFGHGARSEQTVGAMDVILTFFQQYSACRRRCSVPPASSKCSESI